MRILFRHDYDIPVGASRSVLTGYHYVEYWCQGRDLDRDGQDNGKRRY